MLAEAKKRAPKLDLRERLIIFGQDSGQPAIALRKSELDEVESLITFVKQFEGQSKYKLGAPGPPGECDCSGLTMHAVQAVFDLSPALPHSADGQMNDSRSSSSRTSPS